MHRTHHRAPVKRDSWYIGWKEKRGASGGVKELEHRELKKKKTLRESERRGESRREKLMFRATLEKHGGEALREISN